MTSCYYFYLILNYYLWILQTANHENYLKQIHQPYVVYGLNYFRFLFLHHELLYNPMVKFFLNIDFILIKAINNYY